MTENVIEMASLVRKFGELVAVSDVSLSIGKGELFGLLGPNGAGKTTLLKLLTGQLDPTSGSAKVLGIRPYQDPVEAKRKVGIVPEVESPPSFLTGKEYLHYIGMIRDLEGIEERAKNWIRYLNLEEFQDVLGKDMSKGTKQRLMLAAAFIHDPPLLFLDEPFIGLDPNHQKKVREHLKKYLSNGGTIFMCTHILEIAEKVCTRIAIIDRGRIVAIGTLDELTGENETLDEAFLRLTEREVHE
jgi:ABC-2 type transport system ATP-binding protein